jgi:hypothetical protein
MASRTRSSREAVTAFVMSSWVISDLAGLTHKKRYTTRDAVAL